MTGELYSTGYIKFTDGNWWHPDGNLPSFGAGSIFDVTFRVDTPHRYRLFGSMDWGNTSDGVVSLDGPGLSGVTSTILLFGARRGTLQPGTYRMMASAGGDEDPNGSDRGGIAEFDLALREVASPVPEPGSWLLIGLGALGLCVWRKARTRTCNPG